jgi:hypothetical protein
MMAAEVRGSRGFAGREDDSRLKILDGRARD